MTMWRDKVNRLKEELRRQPTFEELLVLALSHKMTAEEVEEQRQSWVVGEIMMHHPEMTRDEAISRYKEAWKRIRRW